MKKIFIICASALFLSACGAGTTTIIDGYEGEEVNLSSAILMEQESTVDVPEKIKTDFKESMDKQFFDKDLFTRGSMLQVKYTFIQFEAGSQFSRWFMGGIGNAGEASLTVKVDFSDAEGNHLSAINVGGKIGSGFFGGSVSEALNKAAKEAAEYAAASFK